MKKPEVAFSDSNFRLDEVALAYYAQKIPNGDVTEEFERFVAHHESRGNCFVSWPAAWRTWVLNAKTFAERRTNGAAPATQAYQGIEI